MTTLPDPEPLPEAFENPDESNVELVRPQLVIYYLERTVWVRTNIGAKDSSKLSGRALKAFAKNSGVSRDVTF
jgi:hypothetical protein